MEDSKTSFCSSKFPKAKEIISLNSRYNLGTRYQKGWPALVSAISLCLIAQLAVTSLTWSQEYNKSCRQSCIVTHDQSPFTPEHTLQTVLHPSLMPTTEEHRREKGQTAMWCVLTWNEEYLVNGINWFHLNFLKANVSLWNWTKKLHMIWGSVNRVYWD